ncbi:hypothetical protein VE02_05291 [Pseudogymnoascus sp. 03VT05]|nr:hypothetical protein VE02_05291 [Pseudogymnoascus sp. 03VT05]
MSDPSPPFPDGIKVWHDCPDATIDICFVHGLTGNRDSTWTASKQSLPWPTMLLPPKLPRARLLTWGYDAYVVRVSVTSKNRLIDHANNLLIDLTNDRGASGRPIIFVAHSLGGLVCKEAILSSRNHPEPHLCDVFKHTTGIIFMGTPHRGSWMADWMKIPASRLGVLKSTNKSLLEVLETNNQLLESVNVRFWSMVRGQRESGRRLEISCFFEELPLPVVGHIVSKESATLEGYTSVSVHANHSDMVKFRTENDNGFKRLVGDLMRWEGETRSTTGRLMPASREAPAVGIDIADSNAIYQPSYYLPFLKNRRFVGRATILKTLEKKLFIEKSEAVALVGLGGIGKTQVALQLAYLVKANKQGYSIFWVAAQSEASFEKAYAELAQELGVKKTKEDEDEDVKDLVRRHLHSEKAGRWLLIVDNADDMEVVMGSNEKRGIYRYLPESESGRVVFTTRSRDVALAVAGSHIIDLGEMSQEEAMVFMETSLTQGELLQDKATTVELLRELTYLPLAIAQAVAYLNQNQISVRKYLGLLQGTEQSRVSLMNREFHDRTRCEGSQNAVATTWLVSFAQIQRFDKAAASLLGFLSCIEPKAIPRSILLEVESEEVMEHAIGTLRGRFKEAITCFEAASKWKGEHFTEDNDSRLELEHDLANAYLDDRRIKEAIEILEHVVAVRKRTLEDKDNSRLSSEHALAKHVVAVHKRTLADKDNLRLTSEYSLAVAYHENGQIKEAIEILEHIVAVQMTTLVDEDHSRLVSEQALASAYLDDRQIKEAIEIFEHVVAVRKRTLTDEDDSRLSSEHKLARAYLNNRRIKEAIKILEHVVVVQKRILADEDDSRLTSEYSLATAYYENGQIKEAIEIFEHVVAVQKRILADEDDSRLTSEYSLATAYYENGQIKEAIKILEHIVVVHKRTLAGKDNFRLISEHSLAVAYHTDRRIQEAIKIFEQVVAVQKRMLAEEDHSRLSSEHELARAYYENGQIKEAIEIFEHVMVIRRRTLTDEDHSRLTSEYSLATAYYNDRRIKEAIEIFEHVVAVQKRMLADEDHSRLSSEHELVSAYLDEEMVEEAI